ncbi:MAG: hypothetical protein K2J20_01245, partial [Bacilli bacterium]|nr:hypothetical protein [Bacilli bacterium]
AYYFEKVTLKVVGMENELPNESMITLKPFDPAKEVYLKFGSDTDAILNYLVYRARLELAKVTPQQNLLNCDLEDKCKDNALFIYNLALSMGIQAVVKIIEPGYIYDSKICNGGCKHCVVIIVLGGRAYLIDCTYSQFFLQKRCLLERNGIVSMPCANPGVFMTMNESRRKTAGKVLNDGWMELTPENIKNYFDGFSLYYRNGLYYEITNDFSFTTFYDSNDYARFLNHVDNQANHEPIEGLGYQRRLLKEPHMIFERKG